MIRAKARAPVISPFVIHRLVTRHSIIRAFLALALATGLSGLLHAQAGQTVTILMLDGKTGKPLVPNNYIVRFDHLNAIHNEALQLNDDGSGKVTIPANASFFQSRVHTTTRSMSTSTAMPGWRRIRARCIGTQSL